MGLLIDSSVLVAGERRGQDLGALGDLAPNDDVAIAVITVSELLVGVHRATLSGRRVRRAAFVERILDAIPVLTFDLTVARRYAELWADLARVGLPIGAHDSLIAAITLTHDYAVLTDNVRHFGRVPDLIVRQPTW